MSNAKRILIKSLNLEKCFKSYKEEETYRKEVYSKFEQVWGADLARHFLMKYEDAESLIWALDDDNLDKFIKHW